MRRLILLLGGVVLAASGCASVLARRQFDALPLLSPAAFGAESAQLQRLTVRRLGSEVSMMLDAAVEVDSKEMRVAAFFLGQRVLLLAWDGERLMESRDPMVPDSLRGHAILRDLQLVYWPAQAIESALPRGCRLEENAGHRRFSCGTAVVLESERRDATPLGGGWLQNNLGHYRITIESAQ